MGACGWTLRVFDECVCTLTPRVDVNFSNIPDMRLAFRFRVWNHETVMMTKFGFGLNSSTAGRVSSFSTPSLEKHKRTERLRQEREGRVWFARVAVETPDNDGM